MATRTQHLLGLLLAVGLVASACGSDPESVIVGAADDAADGASVSDITDAGATVSRSGLPDGPVSASDLLGTSWVIDTLDGQPYLDEAGLTFFDDRNFSIAHNDPCSAGIGQLVPEADTYRFELWAPSTSNCTGHTAALFSKSGATFSITFADGVLSLAGSTGRLTAIHFQSVSIHDELLELPSVPMPDILEPVGMNPEDVVEDPNNPIPQCNTLDSEIIDLEDLDSEVLSSMLRLHVVRDELPFFTDVGIDEFGSGGTVVIEMSAFYGPTIDWLAQTLGSTPACLLLEGDRGQPDGDRGDSVGAPPETTVVIAPTTTAQG